MNCHQRNGQTFGPRQVTRSRGHPSRAGTTPTMKSVVADPGQEWVDRPTVPPLPYYLPHEPPVFKLGSRRISVFGRGEGENAGNGRFRSKARLRRGAGWCEAKKAIVSRRSLTSTDDCAVYCIYHSEDEVSVRASIEVLPPFRGCNRRLILMP